MNWKKERKDKEEKLGRRETNRDSPFNPSSGDERRSRLKC